MVEKMQLERKSKTLSQVRFNALHREYCIQKKADCENCGSCQFRAREVAHMEELKKMQETLDHRTEVIKRAEQLISQCRIAETLELLKTI